MQLEYVSSPRWENAEHTMVFCEAKFVEKDDLVPITVHDHETIPHRGAVWDAATADTPAEYVPVEENLTDHKKRAKDIIDYYAGIARSRYITASPGQELTYQEKAEEAADYVAAGYPSPTGSPPVLADYPFIQAEVDATEKSHTQAADDILAQKSAWIAVGALIEKHRIRGKFRVDSATSAEIDQIVSDTIAALQNS